MWWIIHKAAKYMADIICERFHREYWYLGGLNTHYRCSKCKRYFSGLRVLTIFDWNNIGIAMDKELLFSVTKKDLIIEPYKGSGKGGQHRNKTMSCVRIKHPESGAEGIGTEHREQEKNKKLAFKRLTQTDKFKKWCKIKAAQYTDETDLKIEYL